MQACAQITDLMDILQNMSWDFEVEDSWRYIWGSANYSTRKTYLFMQGTTQASPLFPWLWATGNLGKQKFFFWLLMRDRLNTRNILRRKNKYLDDYSCIFCNSGAEETCFHLFFECPFSNTCWQSISINWNMNLQPLDMVIDARTTFGSPIFREVIITAC